MRAAERLPHQWVVARKIDIGPGRGPTVDHVEVANFWPGGFPFAAPRCSPDPLQAMPSGWQHRSVSAPSDRPPPPLRRWKAVCGRRPCHEKGPGRRRSSGSTACPRAPCGHRERPIRRRPAQGSGIPGSRVVRRCPPLIAEKLGSVARAGRSSRRLRRNSAAASMKFLPSLAAACPGSIASRSVRIESLSNRSQWSRVGTSRSSNAIRASSPEPSYQVRTSESVTAR